MMNGWLWLILALILAGLELVLPGWVLMGISGAIAVMGLLLLTGIWGAGLPLTLVITALLSAVIWFALRRLSGPRGNVRIWDRDIND
ncbi:hypothetical protein [Paracoccus sp. (in: a-proteobacteria)]|uniref:hypothetical protein n=1 Tax=Paracoccus sp. TaxID=267 RepID=UPI0026DF962C|nr:hypothetical protein [Paracoccus sp. (in: a-proteobacteria)]MDO5648438.1 hypothetical protein [Paracoccus sp. (in: a-proteobacteria)]